ncbi:MerR family transcriptional regulator [Microbacterium marinilacus]|uniref:HTH merR-type domain-containing protein n=1 Tax=Microbacterium marinilacus TaxID=415209 RepID=A0ABP7BKB7_9MICO|nr:MerR family transcriptional regulator [Microbacterium marinilacus]MBY0689782.1 MerR family transcriptional regulator [Microbacterium marinilacus]
MTTTDRTAEQTTYGIGRVSELTGLSTHALRFYEQEGLLLAPVRRDGAGRRLFTEEEVGWLKVCTKLRSSGMPLPEIQRYAQLAREGAGNEAARLEILQQHEERVQQQVADLQEALATIHFKIDVYARGHARGQGRPAVARGPGVLSAPSA